MNRGRTHVSERSAALRIVLVCLGLLVAFGAITIQLGRLAWQAQTSGRLNLSTPNSESFSRPDILDRDGNVLARDIMLPSITANPSRILDVKEVIDSLTPLLPPVDAKRLPGNLADRSRRFIWVSRKVSTALAEKIHNLGLPGVGYRWETKRTYPAGRVAGHVIGAVDANSAGIRGLERHMDVVIGLRLARYENGDLRPPLRTTLSIAAQHALEDELKAAMAKFSAPAASGVIMDVTSGEIAAAVSLPSVDPAFPEHWISRGPIDRLTRGTYELGSIFKIVTVAMGLDLNLVTPHTRIDVGTPIRLGRFTIKGSGSPGAEMSVHDILVRSINTGTAAIARRAGPERQRAFLARVGLLSRMETEAGAVKRPMYPKTWGEAAIVTVSYGHGIAVAPIQFASAAASLVNGGFTVTPTFIRRVAMPPEARKRVVSEQTSRAILAMMRASVTSRVGTSRKARARGYRVAGKTGTADLPNRTRGYDGRAVVTSFVGAFPSDRPRFLVMVTLYDPKPIRGSRVAGDNAAPTARRVIERVAPILGVFPGQSTRPRGRTH
ncbi:MAG: penicillin-binding protein 2 [Pseudomonadota bacterium]